MSQLTRALADPAKRSPANWARRRRFALFRSVVESVAPRRILDVGGEAATWEMADIREVEIVLLNITSAKMHSALPNLSCVVGDAREMSQFGDGEFDLIYSNSVIEHVGTIRDQRLMADEVRRVGRHYFVQTPNFWFPVEPHFLTVGYQYLPMKLRIELLLRSGLGQYERASSADEARAAIQGIRLLTRREFAALFPDGRIADERLAGLTKSFMAIR